MLTRYPTASTMRGATTSTSSWRPKLRLTTNPIAANEMPKRSCHSTKNSGPRLLMIACVTDPA